MKSHFQIHYRDSSNFTATKQKNVLASFYFEIVQIQCDTCIFCRLNYRGLFIPSPAKVNFYMQYQLKSDGQPTGDHSRSLGLSLSRARGDTFNNGNSTREKMNLTNLATNNVVNTCIFQIRHYYFNPPLLAAFR